MVCFVGGFVFFDDLFPAKFPAHQFTGPRIDPGGERPRASASSRSSLSSTLQNRVSFVRNPLCLVGPESALQNRVCVSVPLPSSRPPSKTVLSVAQTFHLRGIKMRELLPSTPHLIFSIALSHPFMRISNESLRDG